MIVQEAKVVYKGPVQEAKVMAWWVRVGTKWPR